MDGFLVGRPWMPPGGRPGVLLEKEQLRVHRYCPSVSDAASDRSFGASFSAWPSRALSRCAGCAHGIELGIHSIARACADRMAGRGLRPGRIHLPRFQPPRPVEQTWRRYRHMHTEHRHCPFLRVVERRCPASLEDADAQLRSLEGGCGHRPTGCIALQITRWRTWWSIRTVRCSTLLW